MITPYMGGSRYGVIGGNSYKLAIFAVLSFRAVVDLGAGNCSSETNQTPICGDVRDTL
jgi:hypothetical protein